MQEKNAKNPGAVVSRFAVCLSTRRAGPVDGENRLHENATSAPSAVPVHRMQSGSSHLQAARSFKDTVTLARKGGAQFARPLAGEFQA